MGLSAEDELRPAEWPPRLQVAAAIGWSSFLAACLGALLGFAVLDPQWIIDGVTESGPPPPGWLTRTGVYTLAFFLFWLIGAVAAALTAYLARAEQP